MKRRRTSKRKTETRVPQVSTPDGVRPGMRQKLAPGLPSTPAQVVQIEKPVYRGNFLARVEGKTLFVPLALPGEQARVRIVDDKSKRGYAIAEVEEIVSPAPERITPRCPHFGPCGGCQYQHADYSTQLAMKESVLRETLERAGIVVPDEIALLSSGPWDYRNRIRVALDSAGNIGYRGRRSHAIVPIRECPISAPLLVRAALAVAELAKQFAFRPSELALFCDVAEASLLTSFFVAAPMRMRFDEFAIALKQRVPELTGAALILDNSAQPRTLATWGTSSLTYSAAAADYRVDNGAFFQVNRWLIDGFVERVIADYRGALAWDLFAGVGLFARHLAARFAKVVAVESSPAATAALAANLAHTSGDAVAMPTFDFLRRNTASARPDLIVVDPPRTGLGPEITSSLIEIAAPALVYVSCDPATLARDLRMLLAAGYEIGSITLADLFPQTFHLETVVHLRKS